MSLFSKYEGPPINAALIWSIIKICERSNGGSGATKKDIIDVMKRDFAPEFWDWMERKVENSIATALKIGLINERKESAGSRYYAADISLPF